MSIMSVILPENVYFNADPSSETQGQLVGAGKSLKTLTLAFDFSSPEFFSRPFKRFSSPSNCPWVSEDDADLSNIL